MARLATAVLVVVMVTLPGLARAQGPRSCTLTAQNLFVQDVLRDLYLWSDRLPDVDARQFPSPEAYLDAVRHQPLDSRFSYIGSAAESDAFYSESQFIGYGFSTSIVGNDMVILQVFPDSPAADAALDRGYRVLEIDGRRVEDLITAGAIGGAFGPSTAGISRGLLVQDRQGEERLVTLVKRPVVIPTVSLTRVIDLDGRRVGYLFFRNFVRPSVAALDEAFAALAEAEVTELILDLRYNGGGLVDVAVHLGSLIGGALTAGQPFATYAHNTRNAFRNQTLRFRTLDQPALRVSRLVAITTRASASASELVLNALSPFMPVVIVGDATYGKPVGQYLIEFCGKVVAPVSFSMRNARDEGDYFEGLPPTCVAADDAALDLGDVSEAALSEALHFIEHGTCRTVVPSRALRVKEPAVREIGWRSVLNAH